MPRNFEEWLLSFLMVTCVSMIAFVEVSYVSPQLVSPNDNTATLAHLRQVYQATNDLGPAADATVAATVANSRYPRMHTVSHAVKNMQPGYVYIDQMGDDGPILTAKSDIGTVYQLFGNRQQHTYHIYRTEFGKVRLVPSSL